MRGRRSVLLAASALAGLLWFAWWSLQTPAPPVGGSGLSVEGERVPAARTGALGDAAKAGQAEAAVDRQVEAAPIASTTGSLRVQVFWDKRRTPAGDVLIRLFSPGDYHPLFDVRYARSSDDGAVCFAALLPGPMWVQPDRGGNDGVTYVVIVAGQEVEAEITLGKGMDARGIVVDGQAAPVSGAELLIVGRTGGIAVVLGHSGADGRFLLRQVGTHCSIGASAPGFSPSPMRTFTGSRGGEVEFEIRLERPGSALEGTVSDPGGRPVAGAIVQAGSAQHSWVTLPDGDRGTAPLPRRTITDAQGRFRFAGLPVGPMPLAVRARGLAPLTQEIGLPAGRTLTLDLRLLPSVTLVGTVRDAAGQLVKGVPVFVGGWEDLSHERDESDADGAFRLEGLAAGELELRARSEEHGHASNKLLAVPGQTLRWDVVFPAPGQDLHGRVLDHLGEPVIEAMIQARGAHAFTDTEGRFTLRGFATDAAMVIAVHRSGIFPVARLEGVRPGPEELLIRLPKPAWVHIRGRVVDPEGKPLANVHVSPSMKGAAGGMAATTDATTGVFDLGPYPPGEYSLRIRATGYPPVRFPPRPIAPEGVWEVGTVQLQHGGLVAASLLATDGRDLPEARLGLFDAAGVSVGYLQVKEGHGRAGPLLPGEYVLQVALPGLACVRQAFTIRAKETTLLDLSLQPGIPVVVDFRCAAEKGRPSVALTHARVVLTGPEDAVVLDRSVSIRGAGKLPGGAGKDAFVPPPGGRLEIMLLPGRYRLAATTASEPVLAGEAVLEVAAPGPVETKVVLRAR